MGELCQKLLPRRNLNVRTRVKSDTISKTRAGTRNLCSFSWYSFNSQVDLTHYVTPSRVMQVHIKSITYSTEEVARVVASNWQYGKEVMTFTS